MALQRSGTLSRSGGISAAIGKNLRLLNLKPVKRITIKYDPFNITKDVRDFNSLILSKKVVKTNVSCLVKTDILSDRSESEVIFDLINGKKYIFKCANLNTLELLQQVNKHITVLAPVEDSPTETKSEKKGKKR